ncbi:hypothetical protein Tco_1299414 [Tanacetum coccineum]
MASDDIDQEARYALSKLLQRGTVAEYEIEFLMLIKRVTGISESLLTCFYTFGLKPALQCALLRSYPSTLGEAFFRACITEARFEDENNQAVDTNVGDQEDLNVKDKQEVKKADDDTNKDDFGCSLPPHKGVDLTVEKVVLENIKSDLKKDEDEQVSNPNGVFNDVGWVGYSKADGKWVPARRIEDG